MVSEYQSSYAKEQYLPGYEKPKKVMDTTRKQIEVKEKNGRISEYRDKFMDPKLNAKKFKRRIRKQPFSTPSKSSSKVRKQGNKTL